MSPASISSVELFVSYKRNDADSIDVRLSSEFSTIITIFAHRRQYQQQCNCSKLASRLRIRCQTSSSSASLEIIRATSRDSRAMSDTRCSYTATAPGFHFINRRLGSDAVGGGGSPFRSSSSTYESSICCLSSATHSSTRCRWSF